MSYDDIIDLPHHVSTKRAPMSMTDRAAQFAPFAALTGYDATIRETSRLVERPVELTQSRREELDAQLRELADRLEAQPPVVLTHFVPDGRKQGGAYVRTTGRIRRVDVVSGVLVLTDGSGIEIGSIIEIELPE